MVCGGGLGEKSGGVEGAGVYAWSLAVEASVSIMWWLCGRVAVIDVKDCEKEKTCNPSM